MPNNDYRLIQIASTDIAGQDAAAFVLLIPKRSAQTDQIDGDTARTVDVRVKLTASERQALQAIRDRAVAKMDARCSAKSQDASVELDQPLPNEDP